MDRVSDMQALGISLPSAAYIFGAIFFGIVGFAAYRYGKATERQLTKWLGVALMLYPYVVSSTWMLYGVGVALCAAIAFDRG